MPDDRLLSARRHYVPREIHHLTRLQLLIWHLIDSWKSQINEIDGICCDHVALPSVDARASVIGSRIGQPLDGEMWG